MLVTQVGACGPANTGGGGLVNAGCGAPVNAGARYGFEAKRVEPELGPYGLNTAICPGREERSEGKGEGDCNRLEL